MIESPSLPSLCPEEPCEEDDVRKKCRPKQANKKKPLVITPSIFEIDDNPDNVYLYQGTEVRTWQLVGQDPIEEEKNKRKGTRNYWMFPRQFRSLKTEPAHKALIKIKENLIGKGLTQDIENVLRREFVDSGIMSYACDEITEEVLEQEDIVSINGHISGSISSIPSGFKAVGLLYVDDEGLHQFTESAQCIVNLDPDNEDDVDKMDEILTHLFCRIQLNSEYFRSAFVRTSREIRVPMIPFIGKVLKHHDIEYLTKEEMALIYNVAKTIKDINKVINLILKSRKIGDIHGVGVKIEPTTLQSCLHTLFQSRNFLKKNNKGYTFDTEYKYYPLYQKYIDQYDTDSTSILSIKRHGELIKTRTIVHRHDNDIIKKHLLKVISKCVTLRETTDMIRKGFSKKVAYSMLKELETCPSEYLSPKYTDDVVPWFFDSKDMWREAELAVMRMYLGMKIQAHDTSKIINKGVDEGRFSDILTVDLKEGYCGITDSKTNSKGRFDIDHNMRYKMHGYVKKNDDLLRQLNLPSLKIAYICYICSGYINQKKNLLALERLIEPLKSYRIPVSIIGIEDFLIVTKKNITPERYWHVMKQGGELTWKDF